MSAVVDGNSPLITSRENLAALEQFARKFGETANAQTIFAPPIEKEGMVIIPVGKAQWRIGAGNGNAPQADMFFFPVIVQGGGGNNPKVQAGKKEEAEGGGVFARASITPTGYIVLKNGQASFKPIIDTSTILNLKWPAIAFIIAIALRTLTRPLGKKRHEEKTT